MSTVLRGDSGVGHNRTESVLTDAEVQYRRLFETAQDGILILDAHSGLITDVNPFLIRLLDHPRKDLIGKALWDIGSFRQIGDSKAAFRELQEKEYIRYENLPLETRTGGRVNVEFVSNVYELNGKRLIQCNIRDISARKQAERILAAQTTQLARQAEELASSRQALEDKTTMLQSVLDSMSEGLAVADVQGNFLIWNPAATKMLGRGAAKVGIPLWAQHYGLYLPDRRTPFPFQQLPLVRAFHGEASSAVMLVKNRGLAEGIFVEAYASPLRGKQGIVTGGVVAFRDVTERKDAVETLREYQKVVEGLEEMILVVDRQYRYVIANRAYLNFRGGMASEQVVGHFVDEVVGKEVFQALIKAKMDECFLGRVVQYQMAYDSPLLGHRDLSVSYFPIEAAGGVERIACVLQDITKRKLVEKALRKSEERFSKAFRNNPLSITISTEAEGRFLDVNDAFLHLLGCRRQDVIGRTATEVRFWDEPADRIEIQRQLKEGERVAKHVIRYRTAKGEIREAETWVETIELDGQLCLLGITRDITEIRHLEAQFRQAQKMEAVGRLAGGIAHDFNNILSVIMGYSDLSLSLIASDNPAYRYAKETKKAAERAGLLTQQLLTFSRKQVVFPKILDLNQVVHHATSMFLRLVGEDIAIDFRPDTSIGHIKADRGQIEQVLMNLVVNARDAMPTGGRIVIETARTEMDENYVSHHPGSHVGPNVVLAVSDTGCGMDESIRSQIFEPFFTTKAAGQGTGLGLSTVYGIVKQSGGYIVVYTESGKGTTFKIYFPSVRGEAADLVSSQDEAEPPHGSETILVVEDDDGLREITVKLLQDSGYRVVAAGDAEEALKLIRYSEPKIDLLLTDVIMPGTSGPGLVKLVREGYPNLRWVFMSGYTGELVGREGVVMKEAYFLEKPFTKRSLLRKVYAVLHGDSLV